jgi:hypothetical protein
MREFIERLNKILNEIETERGPIDFAALVEREETPGKYDLLVSAPWITREKEFYQYLAAKLRSTLTDADWYLYSRAVVLNEDGEFVQELSRLAGLLGREKDMINFRVANVNVLYAHLFPTHAANLSYA